MKVISTFKKLKEYSILFLAIFFLLLLGCQLFAQTRTYANDQIVGETGVCVGCTVTNPQNAVNANRSDFSTLNLTLGLLIPPSTYQTLIFSTNKLTAGTPVTVKLGTGDQLLSLEVLGAITLQAFDGNNDIGRPVAASALVSALSNNNQVEVTFTPNQAYDRVRVTLNGGVVAALSNIYLYGASFNKAGPTACDVAVDELNGISSGLLGLGASVGGVVNPERAIDGNLNTASTLNAGVGLVGAYAQQTVIFSNPSVLGDSVRLTLSLPQTLLDAGVLSNIQVSTANGTTNNRDNQNLSSSLLNVRLLGADANGRKVTVTFAPTAIFDRVQLRLGGGIANALSTLNFYEAQRLIPRPLVSINGVAGNNITACTGTAFTLSASARANTVFNWYNSATGGSPIFTGSPFQTPALTATTTYYVEAVRNGCTNASERAPVILNITPLPAAPVVANNTVTVCAGQRASFTAQNMAGITFAWYTTPTAGTPVTVGNTFTTPALTATTKYYAEAANGQCISTNRTEVTAIVSDVPANPTVTATSLTACSGLPSVISITQPVAGIQYNFYTSPSGGTPLYTGTNFTTPVLSANTNYYVEAVNTNGCTSAQRVAVNVVVPSKPANPVVAVSNSNINVGQTATLMVSNAQTGVTYNWYASATAVTPVFTGVTYQTPALYNTTSYYVEAVNSNGCVADARTRATVNVNADTNAPCSFANQQTADVNNICVGCTITNRNLAIDADTTTASNLSVAAGLTGGNVSQTLTFQQAGIAGDTIKLVVKSPTGLADVAATGAIQVEVLNGTTVVNRYTLDNSTVKVRVLGGNNRYAILVPATGTYDGIRIRLNSGTASLVNSLQIFYAAQQFPKPVFQITNPEICKNASAQINITSPTTGTFNWFTTPTAGNAVFTGTNFTTPALTATTTYYVEYTRNGCTAAARYPVTIQVDDVPVKPVSAFNTTTICAGETTTLTATAAANATVKWYTTATSGNAVFTGTNFITPAITATTTYYAEASLGGCVSPDRTAVTVNVNQSPLNFAVAPATQTVNAGETVTFTASSSTADASFNWYNSATGGSSFYTGASYTTLPLSSTTTYYVEAVSATGCRSANRIAVTATVNPATVNNVPCDAVVGQTTDINGLLCVNCTVTNPQNAVDPNSNSFSQLNVAAGLVNAYAQQTLRFANTGSAGDSVVVDLGFPANLANISALSQIQLATYNGSTYNDDRFSINNNVANIRVLADQNRVRIAFPASKAFDRVEIRLNSTAAGLLNALRIYDAAQEVAAPVISPATVNACSGMQTTLTATVPDHVTVNWYTTPTGGTPVFTGASFTTPNLTASTTFYAEAVRTTSGCAQTVRTPVTVTVTPQPAVPVVPIDQVTVCAGQRASFTAQNMAGVTNNWFTAPTGGTSVFSGDTFVSGPLTTTTKFYVEASAGTCTSATRKEVTANVSDAVTNPVVTQASVQACAGTSATLTATSPQPGVTFQWFDSATAATPIYTGANFTTPVLTAANQSYFVQAGNGNCDSPDRVKVDVVVNPAPDAPTVSINPANGQVAAGQTATLTPSSATTGTTFRYYAQAQGGTPLFQGTTFATPALSSNTTYYVEAVSPSGCVSITRTPVNISVNPVLSTTCDLASTQTYNVSTLCATCVVINPGNAVDADLNSFTRYQIPVGVTGGSITQRLTFADQGAVGDTVQILIHVPNTVLSSQVLNGLQLTSYNSGTSNNDQVNANTNVVGLQLLAGGDQAILKFAPQASFNAVELQLNAGAASTLTTLDVFYATKQVSFPQLAQAYVNVCAGSNAVFTVTNPRSDVTYNWFDAATSGNLLFTGTTFTSPALTANTIYYVQSTRTSNSCVNPTRVAATATVTPALVVPVLAQNSFTICAGESVNLSVTNANNNVVRWYDAATGGNLLFTGVSFQTASILSNTHFYAELSNGNCTSPARADVTVTVNPRPAQPGLIADNVTVCTGSSATFEIRNPENNVSYEWFTSQTGGNAVFTGIKFTTPAITQNTTYYVQARSTTGDCMNNGNRTAANVQVTNSINAPTLNATQSNVCTGGTVTLSVTNPSTGLIYNWYTAAAGSSPVYSGTSFTLNNIIANATYYAEATNGSGCTSASRTASAITVIAAPAQPEVQQAGLMVCEGNVTTLKISNPQAGLTYNWFNVANGGVPLFSGNEFTTPALTANTIYYVEAASTQSCNPSSRTAVNVTVSPVPDAPALTAPTVTICAGDKATFTIASPDAGVTYRWFDSPAKTNKLFEGSTFVTGSIAANTDFYADAVNASGCVSSSVTTAHVVVSAAPSAPLVVNFNVAVCSGTQATLNVLNPQSDLTYNWYNAATGGNLLFTGASFTTPALTATRNYYVEAVRNGSCASATRRMVGVTVTPVPPAPAVSADGTAICAGNTTTLTATVDAGMTVKWFANATGGIELATGTSFTTPVLNASTTYYAEARNATGCTSATRTAVTVNAGSKLAAPVVIVTNTTTSTVTFSWTAITGSTGYEFSVDKGKTFTAATARSYTATGLKPAETVTLIVRAKGASDCQLSANSASVTGTTSNPIGNTVWVPNAFTPNSDGSNEILYVYGNTIKTLNFNIYSHWGELLFNSTSISNGWDGTYKGKIQPVGVYVYYVEAVTNDGQTVKLKGTVNIIR